MFRPQSISSYFQIFFLITAELYLTSERLEEALACISEAGSIFPISYMVSYMVGNCFYALYKL